MSSPAFLYGADSDALGMSDKDNTFSLYSNFIIPVLWLALYGPDDVRRRADVEPDSFAGWYLSCSAGAALDRLETRRDRLVEALPAGAAAVLSLYVEFLRASESLHLQCDPYQVLSIQDASGGWKSTLEGILVAFDKPPFETVRKTRFFKTTEVVMPSAGWASYYRYFDDIRGPRYRDGRFLALALAGCGDADAAPWD